MMTDSEKLAKRQTRDLRTPKPQKAWCRVHGGEFKPTTWPFYQPGCIRVVIVAESDFKQMSKKRLM
jgi:hypothetical protein